jgi:hypothetical protein
LAGPVIKPCAMSWPPVLGNTGTSVIAQASRQIGPGSCPTTSSQHGDHRRITQRRQIEGSAARGRNQRLRAVSCGDHRYLWPARRGVSAGRAHVGQALDEALRQRALRDPGT